MAIGTSSGQSYPDMYAADVARYEESQNLSQEAKGPIPPVQPGPIPSPPIVPKEWPPPPPVVDPTRVSDVSPDAVEPGQQYAMMNQPVYPQMEGITAEIDRLASGGVPGPGRGQPLTEVGLQTYRRSLRDTHMENVDTAARSLRESTQRYEQQPYHEGDVEILPPVGTQRATPNPYPEDSRLGQVWRRAYEGGAREIEARYGTPAVPRQPTDTERRQTLQELGISQDTINRIVPVERTTAEIVRDSVNNTLRRVLPNRTTGPLGTEPVTGEEAAPHIIWNRFEQAATGKPVVYPDIKAPQPYKDQSVFLENLAIPSEKAGGSRVNMMQVGNDYVFDHGAAYSFLFRGKDGKVYGDLHVTPDTRMDYKTGKETKQLHVDYINIYDPNKGYEAKRSNPFQKDVETSNKFFSVGYMPNILRQLKSMFPDAVELAGGRISGILAKMKEKRSGESKRGTRQTISLPELD